MAVDDGRVLGFCVLRLVSGEAELFRVAVAGDRRRTGIASRLLGDALRFGASNGAAAVYLEVRQSNEAAIGLYEKHGFSGAGAAGKTIIRTLPRTPSSWFWTWVPAVPTKVTYDHIFH